MGCSPIKTVRELGSERRETVRSLSGASDLIFEGGSPLVREDRGELTYGVPVVSSEALLGSHVGN